jgi:Fanconi anaemia protein FancD2 nuclease
VEFYKNELLIVAQCCDIYSITSEIIKGFLLQQEITSTLLPALIKLLLKKPDYYLDGLLSVLYHSSQDQPITDDLINVIHLFAKFPLNDSILLDLCRRLFREKIVSIFPIFHLLLKSNHTALVSLALILEGLVNQPMALDCDITAPPEDTLLVPALLTRLVHSDMNASYNFIFSELISPLEYEDSKKFYDSLKTFLILVDICKTVSHSEIGAHISLQKDKIVGICLKLSLKFLDRVILPKFIPMINNVLKTEMKTGIPADIPPESALGKLMKSIKTLQLATRSLQHISEHCKIASSKAIFKWIPALKRSLERLIYQVKGILQENNLINLYWLGNLKHRNIQGQEILSQ